MLTASCALLPCPRTCRRSLAGLPATGAKLFYLSGMRNGKYLQREVLNLARFIAVQKFHPLTWRQAHPFLLADRFEVRQSPLHHGRRARASLLMRNGRACAARQSLALALEGDALSERAQR